MTVDNYEVAAAIADARTRQMTAGTYYRNDAGDPDAATRESLRKLGTASVGAAMAEAALAVSANAFVVPIDPSSLTATAEPFGSFDDAMAHYVARYGDGAGLLRGRQRDGSTLVACGPPSKVGWVYASS